MRKNKLPITLSRQIFDGSPPSQVFNAGRLIYEKSGHTLTVVGKYYGCAYKQKQRCSNQEEKMLNANNFDRKFLSYVDDLAFDDPLGIDIHYELNKEAMDIRRDAIKAITEKRNHMGSTLKVMSENLKATNRINRVDSSYLIEEFMDILKLNYPMVLCDFLIKMVIDLTDFKYNNEPVDSIPKYAFEVLFDKIYIDDKGKILKVSLYGLWDFLLQYIDKKIPGYINKFKIPIINRLTFPSLKLDKVIDFFRGKDFYNVLGHTIYDSKNAQNMVVKKLRSDFKNMKPQEVINTGYHLKDILWNLQDFYFAPVTTEKFNSRRQSYITDKKML